MLDKDTIFRFKEFDVRNNISAMKVNTDGVLLGAWSTIPEKTSQIWDVGSGTGIISLMLAQRSVADVTAIEIDSDAYSEMLANFRASKWSNRLRAELGDFNNIWKELPSPQLIISNPPYFDKNKSGLISNNEKRALARHETSLSYESLIRIASEVLPEDGLLYMISPADREEDIEYCTTYCKMNVYCKTFVKTSPSKLPKRILWQIGKLKRNTNINYTLIYSKSNNYSDEFKQLVKDYYLYIND